MTITVNSQSNSSSLVNREIFYVTTTATAAVRSLLQVGFKPRKVTINGVVGSGVVGNKWTWYEGMAAGNAIQYVGSTGVSTLLASNGVTVGSITAAATDLSINVANTLSGGTNAVGGEVVSVLTAAGKQPSTGQVFPEGTIIALGTSVVPASSELVIEVEY